MRVASLLLIVPVMLVGQSTDRPAVYTTEQAQAGRVELKTNTFGVCTDCHAAALTGRKGDPGELPPVSSLREAQQEMINVYGGRVPALVGPEFLTRWGGQTTKDLTKEFRERFGNLSEETRLNLIAYILQANGAT